MSPKKIILFFFTLSFITNVFAQESALNAIRVKYGLPALGVTLIQGDQVTSHMSGVRKWGDPTLATESDAFHLGSDTKAMTATLIALFVERGLLKWDSKLVDIFPELADQMQEDFKNVTVEMLTAHRSGIAEEFNDGGLLWDKISDPTLNDVEGRKDVVRTILSAPPASTPGSQFEYSNYNYMIAGAILEKISGESWEQLITTELFQPLGMASCGFGPAGHVDSRFPDQPWPHDILEKKPVPVPPDFYGDNPPTLGPAGTVHCSMQDWAKFIKMHVDGDNGKQTIILQPSSFQKLHSSYPGQTYTYGGWDRLEVNGNVILTHTGSNTLNYAVALLIPKKNTAVLGVANIGHQRADQGISDAISLFLPKIGLDVL